MSDEVPEMVERVARAIRDELGLDWPYTGHAMLLSTARAAIEAMREPNDLMLRAGDREAEKATYLGLGGDEAQWSIDGTTNVWRAMHSAALGEQSQP